MTFTEAAIEVLRREGKPLHFKKLSEIAVRENLLDHVGKIPEETMADQLAAHCRLPRTERRVMPVQPGTFALVEWGFDEDPAGLENLIELPPEGDLPYRGRERHPIPSRDIARGAGRGEGRPRRREEEERRGRRFPPPAEVAYEILAGAGKPLALVEIAATGAERLLMPDAFVRDGGSLRAALAEDNRRRESAGRKALFQLDGDAVTLVAQPEPGERAAAPIAPRAPSTAAELRRAALATLRRRLRECDGPTVEHVVLRLLEQVGYRDVKVAKRGREHVVCTARKRLGVADVRHAVRIVRSGADAGRRDVVDLRRDLGHYGAQIGVLVTAGEAPREVRGDAGAAGQLPVILLCGEALAEAFAEAGLGCVPVVVPDVDEAFFATAAEAAEREEAARRARREERDRGERGERGDRGDRRERGERGEPARRGEAGAEAVPAPSRAAAEPLEIVVSGPAADDGEPDAAPPEEASGEGAAAPEVEVEALAGDAAPEDEGDDAGDEGEEDDGGEAEGAEEQASPAGPGAEPGAAPGERRRRRRRRRRRGGRGRGGREGAPNTSAPGAEPGGAAAASPPPVEPASGAAPAGPPPERSGEGGGPPGGEGA
jgi:hypothetical protein